MLRGRYYKFDRDRVYTLLSLQPEGSPLRTSIVLDYAKTLLQVFRALPQRRSRKVPMLDILYDTGVWERYDILESGVA